MSESIRDVKKMTREILSKHGSQRAINFARNTATELFAEAGLSVTDGCSVHKHHGTIALSAAWGDASGIPAPPSNGLPAAKFGPPETLALYQARVTEHSTPSPWVVVDVASIEIEREGIRTGNGGFMSFGGREWYGPVGRTPPEPPKPLTLPEKLLRIAGTTTDSAAAADLKALAKSMESP